MLHDRQTTSELACRQIYACSLMKYYNIYLLCFNYILLLHWAQKLKPNSCCWCSSQENPSILISSHIQWSGLFYYVIAYCWLTMIILKGWMEQIFILVAIANVFAASQLRSVMLVFLILLLFWWWCSWITDTDVRCFWGVQLVQVLMFLPSAASSTRDRW